MSAADDLALAARCPYSFDEFVSDTRSAFDAATSASGGRGRQWVTDAAMNLVRIYETDPNAITAAQAMIDRWAALDEQAEAA